MARLVARPYIATSLLALNLAGFALAGFYNLYSCATNCNPRSSWAVVFAVDGTALTPPWYLVAPFALVLLLALRPDRWGLLALPLVFVYAISYLQGEAVESFPHWAFSHNLPFALFLALSYALAAASALAAIVELVIRLRHGGRRPTVTQKM